MLNRDKVLARANQLYGETKLKKMGRDPAYVAPECWPKMESDQIKCLLDAIIEAFNERVYP